MRVSSPKLTLEVNANGRRCLLLEPLVKQLNSTETVGLRVAESRAGRVLLEGGREDGTLRGSDSCTRWGGPTHFLPSEKVVVN